MVEFDSGDIIDRPLSEGCNIVIEIRANSFQEREKLQKAIDDVKTVDMEVADTGLRTREIYITDRVWSRRPWMILEHVRDVWALEKVMEKDKETERSRERAKAQVTGKMWAERIDGEADLSLEITLERGKGQDHFEDGWHHHLGRDNGLGQFRPEPVVVNPEQYVFEEIGGQVSVEDFYNAVELLKEDMDIADSKISCRPL